MATAHWAASKGKMNFYKEKITKDNIKDYKGLIDSIRYIYVVLMGMIQILSTMMI